MRAGLNASVTFATVGDGPVVVASPVNSDRAPVCPAHGHLPRDPLAPHPGDTPAEAGTSDPLLATLGEE